LYFVNTVHQLVVSYLASPADYAILYTYKIIAICIKC